MNPTSSDLAPPPTPRVGRVLYQLFCVLVVYIAVSHVFGDPLPYPTLEIAGAVVIGLALFSQAWQWASWLRSKDARSSIARRAIWTFAAVLFAYGMFRTVYFDPLPGLPGLILLFLTAPAILAASAWSISASRDEVQRASVFEGYTWGAFVGLGLIVAGAFVVRVSPAVSDQLQVHALKVTNGMSPAAVGFGLGGIYALMAVSLCMTASWALWWVRKR